MHIIKLDDNTQQVCLDIVYMCLAPSYKDLHYSRSLHPGLSSQTVGRIWVGTTFLVFAPTIYLLYSVFMQLLNNVTSTNAGKNIN